jgi:polyhydroxyalkanoate synthesis repressor PhaR
MKLIKRYSNRRLYDTSTSSTLTLADLAALIRGGAEIKVIDTVDGKDITVEVMGRILVAEMSSWENARKSQEILRKTITLTGEKSMSLLKNTILASIGAFQVTKTKAEKIIDDLITKGELDKSDRKKAVLELLEKAEKSTSKWTDKVSKEAGKIQKDVASAIKKLNLARQTDLKKIEAKVDRLNRAIKKLEEKLDR